MTTTTPAWVATSIWWHVYPLGALGADTTGVDRHCRRPLSALIDWLDHAVALGVNGIALGPIFSSATHGYDTLDHFTIDERLGDRSDFDALVAACRSRGIRIMLDGVFNHVSRQHDRVSDDVAEGGWERRDRDGHVQTFEGHGDLVTLDHRNPAVADLVVEVMCHWLAAGVDAWRLDAAYAVPQEFWRTVLPRVRERFPDAYVMAEVIHGDYPGYVADTGVDSVTQYELWKAFWSSIIDANMHELQWALVRHGEMLQTFVPWTFVGNHDVTRTATRLAEHSADLAVVLLATLPGTPAVYYGDELGWTGTKEDRVGGDDAVRQMLPDTPPVDDELPPVYRLHQRLFAIRRRFPDIEHAQVRVLTVDQGLLVYEVSTGPPIIVALNANRIATDVTVDLGDTGHLASEASHRDGNNIRLEPGGWYIAGTES